MNDDDIYILVP